MADDPLRLEPETMRKLGYRTVDALVRWLEDADAPPLTRATTEEMRARFAGSAPDAPEPFDEILAGLERGVLPFRSRVEHPRFLAFVPGASTWPGALGDLIASACNIYTGSWMESAGPSQLELEVIGWFKQWLGFPPDAAGLLLTGGSAANLTALVCAREAFRAEPGADLVAYVSDQAHSSLARAARVAGFLPHQLRVLPVEDDLRLHPRTVRQAIEADRIAGRQPFFLAASGGATNAGSVDPLDELADLGLWLHVDAAYGGFAVLTERGRRELAGIDRADSIALDPHKWLYQPYECGCLLVRDAAALRAAFEIVPDYLQEARALGDEVNFSDLGLQLTRTSRALKLWVSLRYFGVDAFRAAIERSLALADLAWERILADDAFEAMAPPALGIRCFRRRFPGVEDEDELELLNAGLVAALERSGIGLVSSTRLRGRYAIRLCVLNHTTTAEDIERVLDFLSTAEPIADAQGIATYERHRDLSSNGAGRRRLVDLARESSLGDELLADAGDTIIERWDTSREFYVVLEGTVEVRINGDRVQELGPGEVFGELAAREWAAAFGYPRLATVVATSHLRLLVLPSGALDRLAGEFPEIEKELHALARERLPRH
jgi:aromatic-L-amino-acid decarboxylase